MTKEDAETRLDRLERLSEEMFAGIALLRESQSKTDEQLNRTDEQLRRTDAKLERIGKQLGDLGLVQGEVAEDLFFRNIRNLFKAKRDMIFGDVKRNLKKNSWNNPVIRLRIPLMVCILSQGRYRIVFHIIIKTKKSSLIKQM